VLAIIQVFIMWGLTKRQLPHYCKNGCTLPVSTMSRSWCPSTIHIRPWLVSRLPQT